MDLPDAQPFDGAPRALRLALAVGVAGALATFGGYLLAPAATVFSYLIALVYALSLALGLLGFLLITHTMDATWPTVVRRLAESGAAVLPLLALLFIPVVATLRHLYPWMNLPAVADLRVRRLLEHRQPFLNAPFFIARSAGYFVLWSAATWALRHWSLLADAAHAPSRRGRMRALSAGIAPAMALTITAAGTDWIMSLSPEWVSYIFGFYLIALCLLGGVSVLILLVEAARRGGSLSCVNGSHRYALGRCLLAFLVLWAYTAFFQFFLIWMADKPTEARWFVDRESGAFRIVSLFLVFGRFGAPFLALLSYRLKWRPRLLTPVAGWLVAAQYIEVHWLIAPQRPGAPLVWMDATALAAVAGFSVAFGLWMQRGHALAPVLDPRFQPATRYDSR
jgi:hypothetical protein